jgi:hypothetical protein
VCKPHLDFLALARRLLGTLGRRRLG